MLDGSPERPPYRRSTSATSFGPDIRIAGPAIVEQYDTTTVIPPGFTAEIDARGNILIDCPRVRPTDRDQDLSTPILMRVIGGAFSSIAKEMAGVLFRMAYSSIIRESEDLGAGIFDRDGNVLAESDSTPMFMGAMPKIVKGVSAHSPGRHSRRRRHPPQRSVPRGNAFP